MILLDKLESLLFKIPVWKLIIILFLIMFFKTGVFYHPNLFSIYLEVAKNPYENIFLNSPNLHYAYTSYLGAWLAYFIGATNKISFFLMHFIFSLISSLLFIKLIFKNFSNEIARISLILFFIFPASSTIYYLVGYDSIIVFLMILSFYFKRYFIITFSTGVLMGLQHFELTFLGSGILLLATIIAFLVKDKNNYNYNFYFSLSLFIGVIFGKLILLYIFELNNLSIIAGRSDWYQEALPHLLYTFFFRFYNIIWFSLGIGWLIIIKYYLTSNKKSIFFIPFSLMILMLVLLPDTTRTFSVMSFFLIGSFILLNENFLKSISKKEITLIFLLWAIIPYGWVWQGVSRPSHFSYTIAHILKHFSMLFDKTGIDASFVWPYFHAF
jgi:hypothetical protein